MRIGCAGQTRRAASREIGQAISQQTAGARSIGEVSARLSDLTREINAATQEQSNGTQQVVSAIEQVRGMAHTNVKSTTDLASSADQLSRQAEVMRDLVSRFQVRNLPQSSAREERLQDQAFTADSA